MRHLAEIAADINAVNRANGWRIPAMDTWDDDYHFPALLALVHSEVSEALEGFRKGDRANVAEELADTVIRILSITDGMGIDIEAEIEKKLEKNRQRGYKHGGKRV